MDISSFIKKNVTSYHLVDTIRTILSEEGFHFLSMGEPWKLKEGAYMTSIADGMLAAFVVGDGYKAGDSMRIGVAHTDYPCFHIKPCAESGKGYNLLDVEAYGAMTLSSWMDRPLGIAGRVFIRCGEGYEKRLIDSLIPVVTIPNLPIHFNREVNKGVELKCSTDMRPLCGMNAKEGWFVAYVANLCDCRAEDILDFDLYVYNSDEPESVGFAQDMLSAPRLDNQTSCFALTEGLTAAGKNPQGFVIGVFFDNEEIGSQTKQGADSSLLPMLLSKIYDGLHYEQVRLLEAVVKSTMLSLDVAHAAHPNHPERFDDANSVHFGEGVVLKLSVNQRYAYEAEALTRMELLLKKKGIPYKKHVNHSDMPGGKTLGPLASSWLPMSVVDAGVTIMAMHSSRELMAKADMAALTDFVMAFFTEESQS